jgi:hypothetical protein
VLLILLFAFTIKYITSPVQYDQMNAILPKNDVSYQHCPSDRSHRHQLLFLENTRQSWDILPPCSSLLHSRILGLLPFLPIMYAKYGQVRVSGQVPSVHPGTVRLLQQWRCTNHQVPVQLNTLERYRIDPSTTPASSSRSSLSHQTRPSYSTSSLRL